MPGCCVLLGEVRLLQIGPYNRDVLVSDFDFHLPPERIAQQPLADRAGSRMLHLRRESESWSDRVFRELPGLVRPDDLLVVNNTKVFPARLYGSRSGKRSEAVSSQNRAARDFLRGRVEVLLTKQVSEESNLWECLVRPGRKIGVGEKLYFAADSERMRKERSEVGQGEVPEHNLLEAEVISRGTFGERSIRFAPVTDFFERIERIGHVPLPPYIDRDDLIEDRERYQTVYSQRRGSVAAPTAGLHFTPEILREIRNRGIEIAEITLHVGLGTFQPVRVEKVEDHKLHRESYEISGQAAESINRAKDKRQRVVAVGTTSVRTLEYAASVAASKGERGVAVGRGEAEIFIYPGYQFRIVDALLTNFHLPQSSLLMLVCALAGRDFVMRAYRHAVEAGYRFYSYGDCMLVE
jgi:S-adenosylmethionine:tRNA ribosyltransferase-isomerase